MSTAMKNALSVKRSGLTRNINEMKRAMELVARMLSDKGVRVIFRGTACATDHQTIYLPELALLERSNMTEKEVKESQEFLDAVRGFLFHEVSHILFTDREVFEQGALREGPLVKQAMNAVEDPRVEKLMAKKWRGAGVSLGQMNEWMLRKMQATIGQQPLIGKVIVGIAWVARTGKDHWFFKSLDEETKALLRKFAPEIRACRNLESTDEALSLGRRIVKKIKSLSENKEEPEPQQGGQPQPGQQGSGEGEEGEGDGEEGDDEASGTSGSDKKPKKGKKPKKAKKDEAEGEGEEEEAGESDEEGDESSSGSDGDGDGSEDEETEAGSSGGSDADDGSDDDEGGSDGSDGEGDSDGEEEGDPQALQDARDQLKDELSKSQSDLGSAIESMQNKTEKLGSFITPQSDGSKYLVFTTENDEIGPAKARPPAEYSKLMDDARKHFGIMKRNLANLLKARANTMTVSELEEGDLDTSMLYRLASGLGDKVFKETHEHLDSTVGVVLLVNESGSMGGNPMRLAQITSALMGEVLDSLHIPFGLYGHTTGDNANSVFWQSTTTDKDREIFTRFGATKIRVYKDFDESFATSKYRIPSMHAEANTHDAEALIFAANKLLNLKGVERRIIMTLDDGQPFPNMPVASSYGYNSFSHHSQQRHATQPMMNNLSQMTKKHQDYVREVVKILSGMKVEVLGMGMGTEDVKHFYPKHLVVKDVKDFPALALKELRNLLLAKKPT